jgi:hypothetical protein
VKKMFYALAECWLRTVHIIACLKSGAGNKWVIKVAKWKKSWINQHHGDTNFTAYSFQLHYIAYQNGIGRPSEDKFSLYAAKLW